MLIILFNFTLLAQKVDVPQKLIVSEVKEKNLEDQLIKSKELKACATLKDEELNTCIDEIVSGLDEKAIQRISADISGSEFKINSDEDAKLIREFMRLKIESTVYKIKPQKKTGPTKVMGHEKYRDIYKSQIGKNSLLEANGYCLETLGIKGGVDAETLYVSKVVNGIVSYENANGVGGSKELPEDEFARLLTEYSGDNKRSVQQLELLKNKLITAAVDIDNNKKLNTKSGIVSYDQLCTNRLISYMCSRYMCNNKKASERTKDEKPFCTTDGSSDGKIACTLLKRMESYKQVLRQIKEQEIESEKIKDTISVSGAIEAYQVDQEDIDDLTTISSVELRESKAMKGLDKKAQEFEDKCSGNSDKKCSGTTISQASLDAIELEAKIATKINDKKIDLLADEDELKEYLESRGEDKKYLTEDEIENGALADNRIDEIKAQIKSDYELKRKAMREKLLEKYKKSNVDAKDQVIKQVDLKAVKEEIADKADYIASSYQYSNFVSSLLNLDIKDSEGNIKSTVDFKGGSEKELNDLRGSSREQEYKDYEKLFSGIAQSSSAAGQDVGYLDFINSVLGIGN